jgi:homoserine trans-succinylase
MTHESVIPGERPITAEEMRLIRDMKAAGRSLDDIAITIGNLAPSHTETVNRLASMLAPKRQAPGRPFTPRRRR